MTPIVQPMRIPPAIQTEYRKEQELFSQMQAELRRCKRGPSLVRRVSQALARISQRLTRRVPREM